MERSDTQREGRKKRRDTSNGFVIRPGGTSGGKTAGSPSTAPPMPMAAAARTGSPEFSQNEGLQAGHHTAGGQMDIMLSVNYQHLSFQTKFLGLTGLITLPGSKVTPKRSAGLKGSNPLFLTLITRNRQNNDPRQRMEEQTKILRDGAGVPLVYADYGAFPLQPCLCKSQLPSPMLVDSTSPFSPLFGACPSALSLLSLHNQWVEARLP